ncbi:MAG TPA: hypothetical protein VE842_11365, partial [Pyrinomonadaceae bacterium]|nr:hypothetical protein [Pyrinomonadaceae bacterium]
MKSPIPRSNPKRYAIACSLLLALCCNLLPLHALASSNTKQQTAHKAAANPQQVDAQDVPQPVTSSDAATDGVQDAEQDKSSTKTESTTQSTDTRSATDKRSALAKSPLITEFNQWLREFKLSGTASASEVRGKELATQRRALMAQLIREDPQSAVEVAVPAHLKAKLPGEIGREVEEVVSGYGDYLVRVYDEIDPVTGEFRHGRTERKVVMKGKTYEARVYGYKEGMTTKHNIAIRGVVMDGVMALAESPVRELEDEEKDAFTEGVEVEV